jgi:hypothetical protein
MQIQEHAPMAGNRRGSNSITCGRRNGKIATEHGTQVTCSCYGSSEVRGYERRQMMKKERRDFRNDLRNGVYS